MSKEFEDKVLTELEEIHKFERKIDERIDKLESRMDKLEDRMDKLEIRMDSMEKTLQSICRSLILIEDQVMNKIPALFEGYSIHQERIEASKTEISSINKKVEDHDIRISYLEEKIG